MIMIFNAIRHYLFLVILVITVAVIIGKKGHKTQEFIEANTDLEKVLAANEEA
ncbi:TPA: hypothetical protein ACGNEF_000730 [Streptococcus agalactiae]|jgi:hypothetical protein|uniref:hypothetical protein n=1 Tax=Streptococcus agalactiae TaxID=1311 RepID=UPI0002DE95E2|nr:hypothetical protein [Streptococcus agalactiae]HEP2817673.1 hypothetical protein [Streptococcus pyogenes]EPX14316.1 hypothetical protein SAG0192_03945 [Streptococcus agalactiae str. Gottschalk 1002A]HEN9295592.1 hypothetical protein [Streptococcus agalactiae]HEO2363221.1 hypothetical protein [Streptococcus agalactiae]HEO2475576.1 hypothetical protein [Streptococcus agalactiae]